VFLKFTACHTANDLDVRVQQSHTIMALPPPTLAVPEALPNKAPLSTPKSIAYSNKSVAATAPVQPLSPALSVVWIFVTHGIVNAGLLSPFNPVRCAYFAASAQASCSSGSGTAMLNWWSLHLLHVHLLLAAWATTAVHRIILEQRLLTMTVAIVASSLSTGISMLPYLNRPMAALQAVVFVGLLLGTAHQVATQHANSGPIAVPTITVTELRNTSFDARRKLPLATVSIAWQFLLVAGQVMYATFGKDAGAENESAVIRCIAQAGTSCMLWVALILGASVVVATAAQQKVLLLANSAILFLSMFLLAVELQGSTSMAAAESPQAKWMVGMFVSLVVSLLGAL
jgi:hypothetical protein